jgi:hypothetical protein
MPDFTGALILAVIYLAYRVGRWVERSEAERHHAEKMAVMLAESYDAASAQSRYK